MRKWPYRFPAPPELRDGGLETALLPLTLGFSITNAIVLAWRVAGWWGVDRWLLPLVGVPWAPGKLRRGATQPVPAAPESV